MNSLISTKEASQRLNISIRRVQALIASGRLPAKKIGNSFAIRESDLKFVNGRKSGRPANGTTSGDKHWHALILKYAGTIEGLPSDLSTNKKYMEGFGRD